MRSKYWSMALALAVVLGVLTPAGAADITAESVFDRLREMAGTWRGEAEGQGEDAEAEAEEGQVAVHEIELSAGGTVVMETMNPGSDHEMINMYHLDGEELVLTHYCASGNQPKMKLNRGQSTAAKWVFDFVGGSNLDPSVDTHIHSAEIVLESSDRIKSVWNGYTGGEPAGAMVFHLARSE